MLANICTIFIMVLITLFIAFAGCVIIWGDDEGATKKAEKKESPSK